jgi:hydrogenase maturation factor
VIQIIVRDYANVHFGFDIERIDQEAAEKMLEVFGRMGVLKEEPPIFVRGNNSDR